MLWCLAVASFLAVGLGCTNVIVEQGDVSQKVDQTSNQGQVTDVDQETGVDVDNNVTVNVDLGDDGTDVDPTRGENEPPEPGDDTMPGETEPPDDVPPDEDLPPDDEMPVEDEEPSEEGDLARRTFNNAFSSFSVLNVAPSAAIFSTTRADAFSVLNSGGAP